MELLGRYSKLLPLPLIKRTHASDRLVESRPIEAPRQPSRPFKLAQRLTDDDRSRLIDQYVAGASAAVLGQQFGIGKASGLRILDDTDVTRKPNSPIPSQLDQTARQHIEERWSLQQIGQHLSFATGTIFRHLKRRGVPMPSRPHRRIMDIAHLLLRSTSTTIGTVMFDSWSIHPGAQLCDQTTRLNSDEIQREIDKCRAALLPLVRSDDEPIALAVTNNTGGLIRLIAAIDVGLRPLLISAVEPRALRFQYGDGSRFPTRCLLESRSSPLNDTCIALGLNVLYMDQLTQRSGESRSVRGDLLISTSGTSGRPRAAVIPSTAIDALLDGLRQRLPVDESDVIHNALPLHHTYGLSNALHALARGATLYLSTTRPSFPVEFLSDIENSDATVYAGVPTHYRLITSVINTATTALRSVRAFWNAGDGMPLDVTEQLRVAMPGSDLYLMYGQTEATSRICILDPRDVDRKPTSCGKPLPSLVLRLLHDDGSEVEGPGEAGEIFVEGPQLMTGYWRSPEESSAALTSRGLRTGDLAKVDSDGDVYILDRVSSFAKIAGERIAVRGLEDQVRSSEDVADCVVQIAHASPDDDVLRLLVVRKSDASGASERDLRRRLSALVPPRLLRTIEFVEVLPTTESGKVIRRYDLPG